MIVIVDSGSTKTEWRLLDSTGVISSVSTTGLNPLAIDFETTITELRSTDLAQWVENGLDKVYFYSAGIIGEAQKTIAVENLNFLFKSSEIFVESDLLGAARAVFGSEQGIIGILGTGSNTGLYNGSEIERQIPPLGYILGDEGSGAVMGKSLLKLFLRNELPADLIEAFKKFYPDYNTLIETTYTQKHASKFLASFVPFLHENKESEEIKEILLSDLNKYINLVQKYPGENKVGIVGSVGFYFRSELDLLARNAGVEIVDYVRSPIEKLTLYHQKLAI